MKERNPPMSSRDFTVYSVSHNMHPSERIETLVFPTDQAAMICYVQLVGEAWRQWFGRDQPPYPEDPMQAYQILEVQAKFPWCINIKSHLVRMPEPAAVRLAPEPIAALT
jgi:hypothetical protein